MSTISLSLPSDGQTIDASDVNTPFNTISAVINGNLDDTNIVSGANINGSKILAASMPANKLDVDGKGGWVTGLATPNTITYNGNRSYSAVFNATDLTSTLSVGQRLRLTRTVAAPTQCTLLNGTTQFFSRTSASLTGMTFTNNFVVSAWIKITSYNGARNIIASRFNGTSGWEFGLSTSGRLELVAYNAGSANFFDSISFQSVPLNKWVHVSAQLDMTTTSVGTTNNYMMLDGVEVPNSVARGGTSPTALVQAGNLEIGSSNGGTIPFPGEIAQVAIYSAKVTQATIKASSTQTLTGTETSLISAYTLSSSLNDLNANANNLTANGSATTTTADSPFAQGATAGTLEYGIITAISFSTNTTITVQVPEGSALPTSGGISAVSYSGVKAPFGMPVSISKWQVQSIYRVSAAQSSPTALTIYNPGSQQISAPIGRWNSYHDGTADFGRVSAGNGDLQIFLGTTNASATGIQLDTTVAFYRDFVGASGGQGLNYFNKPFNLDLAAATTYYRNISTSLASMNAIQVRGDYLSAQAAIVLTPADL